ncbi:unnamed protein product [Leptidea sinapis]|uniref:Kinetochore protein SPC25 n=1 Tax=Leptidea sinapis TaxID=189913 RepID=A0A5E4PMS9_9NEOP|nr:unnamed protein product [Leptidea sinapis]
MQNIIMSVIENTSDYLINLNAIQEDALLSFESCLNSISERVLHLLHQDSLGLHLNSKENQLSKNEEDLHSLIEINQKLRHDIEFKIKDLKIQQTQYDNFKQEQKILSNEIKETHEAYLRAKKYLKKHLKFFFTISETNDTADQVIFVQFFTEARKESECYSVKLSRNIKSQKYTLLNINPELKISKDIQRLLQEDNCVPGVLSCIREAFRVLKDDKGK